MSLRINTDVQPIFRSSLGEGIPISVGQTSQSSSVSALRCKRFPRGSRKANTFAHLTNTELHRASPTAPQSNRNSGGSPRARSVSLFSPHFASQSSENCQLEPPLPCNAATPHSPRGNLALRRSHNVPYKSAYLSMTSTIPTSSLSYSALDMLLKAEPPLESSPPSLEQSPIANKDSDTMLSLDVPNAALSRRSSRSSARNQRMKANDLTKWEKTHFPCISPSPCPSVVSGESSSATSASSSCSAGSSCTSSNSITPSPTDRLRRSPPPDCCPPMVSQSTPATHTFSVNLPRVLQPEMVTVSAKKGDRLDVVADAWHMEHDCHYEWQIRFAPGDVDMSTVRARIAPDGKLTIDVQRRVPGQTCTPNRIGMGFRYRY